MLAKFSLITFFIFCFGSLCINAQEIIKLNNPSFEDTPRQGAPGQPQIRGWHDCGLSKFPSESPPDIHPVPGTAWGVSKVPYDGGSFLGMVVRYNDSYESLSQALSSPIQAGVCYSFTAFIAKSQNYKSAAAKRDSIENFDKPAVFQIWGGNTFCDKAELLGESPAVTNFDWKQYKFLFQPRETHKYIIIEAFFKTPVLYGYNGHILIDNLSDLVKVPCPMFPQDLVAKVSDPPAKVEKSIPAGTVYHSSSGRKSGSTGKTTVPSNPNSPPPFKAVLLPELGGDKVFVGQKIRLNHLYFRMDSVNLLPDSYKVLDELAAYLKANPKTIIEIGGHTNTVPPEEYCNRLSTDRAKAVQEYLISKGIPAYRLEYKGYGKRDPLIPYDKYNKEARFKNQRVEIKILSIT